jgi:tripartite-type tricarboxylate transporter receptor subunit TctC
MPKYIPGSPEIVVQNMPGGGSLVAANYVYSVAKPDGLTMGMAQYTAYIDQLVGRKEVQFDAQVQLDRISGDRDGSPLYAQRCALQVDR